MPECVFCLEEITSERDLVPSEDGHDDAHLGCIPPVEQVRWFEA